MRVNCVKDIVVQSNSVAILGFHDGSAGQVATWFEGSTGYHLACFVHEAQQSLVINTMEENRKRVSQQTEFPTINSFKGRPLVTSLQWVNELKRLGINKVLPLTPNNRERFKQIALCQENGIELVSAIHPTVVILEEARIEPGVWINAGSIIGYKAEIESGVIVNTGVQVDHHNVLKQCCQVDPGVIMAGNVTLRECCHVHTGARIINRKEIGEDAVIGAGAVVVEDIPACSVAVGVPAKVIKRLQEGG